MMPPRNLAEPRCETFPFVCCKEEETLRCTVCREEINHCPFPTVFVDYTRR